MAQGVVPKVCANESVREKLEFDKDVLVGSLQLELGGNIEDCLQFFRISTGILALFMFCQAI